MITQQGNEPFAVVDGYDRNKHKRTYMVRYLTLAEVKELSHKRDVPFIANDGTLRRIAINGAVKTWKRDPNRVEVPVKYGMYEYGRFDAAEALRRFVAIVG